MKTPLFLVVFLVGIFAIHGQSNTEIFLYDLEATPSQVQLKNPKNISNNVGYDNQPSFIDNRFFLFASTRNNQTDIAQYDLRYDTKSWINFSDGGEYTPLKIPNKNEISAVRLDKDGTQRLYAYSLDDGGSTEIIKNLMVAYYTWFNDNTIVSAVIEGDHLNLYVTNTTQNTSKKIATNVGRSFHNIPNSKLISFISKTNGEPWQIKTLNPITGATIVLANTMLGVEDICWLDAKTILSGKDNLLYKLTLKRDINWKQVADVSTEGITKITRLTVNKASNKLLMAGDIALTEAQKALNQSPSQNQTTTKAITSTPEAIVQRNLDAYNARDIDRFMNDYADDIKLYNYPKTMQSEGKERMRKRYDQLFNNTPDLNAVITKRIVQGNTVIDQEQVTVNGKIIKAVAIYEVINGKITAVTFIQ